MRFTEISERASMLKSELEVMAELDKDYVSNPDPSLEDGRAHRQRLARYREIAEELTKLAEETAQ